MMTMKRLIADNTNNAKAKILEIIQSSDELVEIYMKLYQDLTDLYNEFPNIYEELQRVVKLPTNEDAQNISDFNKDIKRELQYLNDQNFMQYVMDDNEIE